MTVPEPVHTGAAVRYAVILAPDVDSSYEVKEYRGRGADVRMDPRRFTWSSEFIKVSALQVDHLSCQAAPMWLLRVFDEPATVFVVVAAARLSRSSRQMLRRGRLKGFPAPVASHGDTFSGDEQISIAAGPGQWRREMIMPSFSLAALPGLVVRPLIVAIAHIPILIVVVCSASVWWTAGRDPETRGKLAVRLATELRAWSHDVIDAVSGGRPQ